MATPTIRTPMKIIALRGPHSCGKTTTLTLLHQELRKQGAKSTNKQAIGNDPADFSDTLIWKGQKIGFLTMGDYSYVIMDFIKDFEYQKYNIFITACNDRFIKPIKKITNRAGSLVHPKTIATEPTQQADANAVDAMVLLEWV